MKRSEIKKTRKGKGEGKGTKKGGRKELEEGADEEVETKK